MSDFAVTQSLIEQALTPTGCNHPRVSLERGDVTEVGKVRTALDPEGHPIDGAAIEGAGAVLQVGRQRVFIPYGLVPDSDLRERVRQVVETQQGQQVALNEASKHAEEMVAKVEGRVDEVADEAHDAALAAASASGIIVLSDTDPLPTVRPGGVPLSTGDLLYLVDLGETPAHITGVRIWDGANWLPYAFAAEHLIAVGSIVGDLIAAETEIISPTITGGQINGAVFLTLAEAGGVATRVINGNIRFELDGVATGYITATRWYPGPEQGVQLAVRGGPLEIGGYSHPTPQRDVNTRRIDVAALDKIQIRTPQDRGAAGVGRVEINSDPIGSSGDVYGDTYIGQKDGTDKVVIKGQAVPVFATGTANLSIPGGSSTTGFVIVNLPEGRFDEAPVVVATAGTTSGGIADVSVYVSGISATQFSVRVTSSNTPGSSVSCPVRWIAVAE